MLEFAYPWILLLLPIPLVIRILVPPYKEYKESIQVPFFIKLATITRQKPEKGAIIRRKTLVQKILVTICQLLFLGALASPQWVGEPIVHTESARDFLVVVDISGSMGTEDFTSIGGQKISRLTAVKQGLNSFIKRRQGDRIGFVVFGSGSYLQVPFTTDHQTFLSLLDEAEIGLAGDTTMLGDAIGFAIKLFQSGKSENRVMVILTDGNDTGSLVPPFQAATLAAQDGIVIYPLAIGNPEAKEEEKLDEKTLNEIATVTKGRYFRVENRQSALEEVYRELDKLHPVKFETASFRPRYSLFHWPLGGILDAVWPRC